MAELPSPIDESARQGPRPAELATSPAIDAIRTRRARLNLGLAWRVLWRLLVAAAALVILEVDLLVEDLLDDGVEEVLRSLPGDERLQVALIIWTVLAVLVTIGVQLLRVLRSRAVQVPPARRFRGIPGIGAVIAATWWIAPAWALALESRSNNDSGPAWLAVDAVAIALLAVGALVARVVSTVELREDALHWRGPFGTFVPGVVPETDVIPIAWESGLMRFAFRLVGFAVWIMASTVAGSLGSLGVALVWAAFQSWSVLRLETRSWPWRDVRLVALEGGVPAVVATGEGVLDLAPMVSATSRNERMVWTIADLARRAGASDDVDTVDDQLRDIARDAARAERPTASGPATFRPASGHAIRGRLAPVPSLVIGGIVIAAFGVRAATGDPGAILIFVAVVATLAVVFTTLFVRARRLALEVTTTELLVRGVRGAARRIPIDTIGALVAVPVQQQPGPGETRIDIDGVIVDRTGAFLARLRGGDWSPQQLEDLAASMGVPTAAVQDILPITALSHAFPGYAPTWEREPGKFGLLVAIALVALVSAVVIAFQWEEVFGPDEVCCSPERSEYDLERRERERVEREIEPILHATFPRSVDDGGQPTGCIEFDGPAATSLGCEHLDPALERVVLRLGRNDALTAISALCRCRPSENGSGYIDGLADASARPDTSEWYDVDRDDRRLTALYTLFGADDVVRLRVDLVRSATGAPKITDVRCDRGPDTSLNPIAPGATIESLRCRPEDIGG